MVWLLLFRRSDRRVLRWQIYLMGRINRQAKGRAGNGAAAMARRAERTQQRNRLREVFQPVT
jgi:hypothetical protein